MKHNQLLAVVGIILLTFSIIAIAFVADDDIPNLRMHLVGDRIQVASFNETAHFRINVINLRDDDREVSLVLTDIPLHWNATLDDNSFILPSNSNKVVTLSVNAPDMDSVRSHDVSRVSRIGVRGNNNYTISTLTILKGIAYTFEDGRIQELDSSDQLNSSHIVSIHGTSSFTIDWPLFHSGDYNGNTTIVLEDSHVGFLYHDKKIFLALSSGNATFFGEEMGGKIGNRSGNDTPFPVTILCQPNSTISDAFPGFPYQAIIVVDPSLISVASYTNNSLFSLSIEDKGYETEILIEGIEGEIGVENVWRSTSLKRCTGISLTEEEISDPVHIERSVIVVDSDESVEASISMNGINILNFENSREIQVGGEEIFIFDSYLLDVDLELTGRKDGEYSVEFSTVEENVVKSFQLNTTTSIHTTDLIRYDVDDLRLLTMGHEKYFDISITHHNLSTGDVKVFSALNIKTTDEEMGFFAIDWESLDDGEKEPVQFTIGEDRIAIQTGMFGDEIHQQFRTTHQEDKSRPWILIIPIILLIGIGTVRMSHHRMDALAFENLFIHSINIETIGPVSGKPTIFTASIRNDGLKRDDALHRITVNFYDNFESIGRKDIDCCDLTFDQDEIRDISIEWVPRISGPHMMSVSLDVDNTEIHADRMQVSVKDVYQGGREE